MVNTLQVTDVIWRAVKQYWKLRQTSEVPRVLLDAALAGYQLQPDSPPPAAGLQSSQPADSMAQYHLQ